MKSKIIKQVCIQRENKKATKTALTFLEKKIAEQLSILQKQAVGLDYQSTA